MAPRLHDDWSRNLRSAQGTYEMKVVVQNAAGHVLTRKDVERMIPLFPDRWVREVDTILLCRAADSELAVTFHAREKVLALSWPGSPKQRPSKVAAVDELLVALAAIAETGGLPRTLSTSRRAQYLTLIADVRARCLVVLDGPSGTPMDAR